MRHLDWDGLPNLRDLGGIPTPLSDTGSTRPGRIARGPRRELLTRAGWAAARRWGLRTVVDLRNTDERGRRPGDPDSQDRHTAWGPAQVAAWLPTVTPHVRALVEDVDSLLDELELAQNTRIALKSLLTSRHPTTPCSTGP